MRNLAGFWAPALAILASVGPVAAADLYVPEPELVVDAPAAPYDWTGFYVGVIVGYGWADKYAFDEEDDGSYQVEGWLAGIEAGANWQTDMFVLGIEGDVSWTDMQGDGLIDNDDPIATQINFLATLTARAGVAWEQALFYVEAGGAWVSEEHTLTDGGTSDTVSDDRVGGLLGIGLEYAVSENVSLKAEYNYIFLGSKEYEFDIDGGETIGIEQNLQTFKVGLNYRF